MTRMDALEIDDFRAWEIRGRGWLVWPYAVELEPPFRTLGGHEPRPPVIESLPDLEIFGMDLSAPITDEDLARFVLATSKLRFPVVLECHRNGRETSVRLGVRTPDSSSCRELLRTRLPANSIEPRMDPFDSWKTESGTILAVVEWGLDTEFILPMQEANRPAPAATMLKSLTAKDRSFIQVIFQPARAPWASGVDFGLEWKDLIDSTCLNRHRLIEEKLSRPLVAVVLRTGLLTRSGEEAYSWASQLDRSFESLTNRCGNRLIPIPPSPSVCLDLTARTTHRSGMLLTADELARLLRLALGRFISVQETQTTTHEGNSE